ncbi:unnamed protein product [Aspergillus oryzae]|uniref:Unnamed protein product n=2 Tax=Aspergillus oryzae TaxID=5062 RepID=A0AAN4YMP5_ASPOZ|nr:unnamed protein product [Aspergillus oryzae]GMF84094.1 unnamed protein product [Aspergillus oryzae]GMG01580.1 unnamed protein product [Aspergillus oryzae]GMG33958.1 unnamed protein product [Aspergillus oryzae]GMG42445.1 unnamed protein product [Aspergillus oryzae var. brunneus]
MNVCFRQERGKSPYLRRLEADSKRLQNLLKSESSKEQRVEPTPQDESDTLPQEEHGIVNPLFETQPKQSCDKQTEPGFTGEASCIAFGDRLLQCISRSSTPSNATLCYYHPTKTANRVLDDNEYTLPDRTQAKLLVNVAWRFIGNDHHLFLKISFMQEIEAVYQTTVRPTVLWLCKLLALLALGELYTNRRKLNDAQIIPGTNYYLQALHMLHDTYEEATLLHVEVLILIVSASQSLNQRHIDQRQAWYSNSLGRIRSAYSYSGVVMRLALSLGLHRSGSAPATATAVELESRRRTWWMLYYFERMSASKLGLPITARDEDIDVELPSMNGLTEEEQQEFADPAHICANVKLARITGNICTSATSLTYKSMLTRHKRLSLIQAGVSTGSGSEHANPNLGRSQYTDRVQQVGRTRNHGRPSDIAELAVQHSISHSLVADSGMNCADTLAHPLMDTFLDENLSAWPSSMFMDDNAWRSLATEMEEHFLF